MGLIGRDAQGRREVFGSRGFARALGNFFDPLNIAAAQAAMSGDHATAARLALAMQERRDQRRTARAEAYQRDQLGNILQKPEELGGEGFTEAQRALAMAHPESFFTNWNTRYRTDEITQGNSRPNIGGGGQVRGNWRAPQTIQNGDDLQFIDYQGAGAQGSAQMPGGSPILAPPGAVDAGPPSIVGQLGGAQSMARGIMGRRAPVAPSPAPIPSFGPPGAGLPSIRTVPMRTDAEQRAATLGLQPGTPAYETFLRDSYLDAQGPTAVQLTREGHRVQMRGQDVGERNSIRSNETTRRGQNIGSADRRRGQDIGSTDRRRGQDIGAETTRQSGAYGQGQRRNLVGQRYRTQDGRVIQYDTVSQTYVTVGAAR